MANPELTVPKILQDFDKTEKVPESMLPLGSISDLDPTKPLRGAFEAILLARIAQPALVRLRQDLAHTEKPWVAWGMIPLDEIDKENHDEKVALLERKRSFVYSQFRTALKTSLKDELSVERRKSLPVQVAYAYERLSQIEMPTNFVNTILSAADTLNIDIDTLFLIAGYDYPSILGHNPSAKQMVELVANSYASIVHLQAARHTQVSVPLTKTDFILGENFTIDCTQDTHKIKFINPAQYNHQEVEMRRKGEITSQTIKCPFSISSIFTEPFLDSDVEPFDTNPLRHTFETLVRDFIGS